MGWFVPPWADGHIDSAICGTSAAVLACSMMTAFSECPIDAPAAAALVDAVGPELLLLRQELAKAALYAGEPSVSVETEVRYQDGRTATLTTAMRIVTMDAAGKEGG